MASKNVIALANVKISCEEKQARNGKINYGN